MKLQILAFAAAATSLSLGHHIKEWRESSIDTLDQIRHEVEDHVRHTKHRGEKAAERLADRLESWDPLQELDIGGIDELDFDNDEHEHPDHPKHPPPHPPHRPPPEDRRNPHDQRDRTLYELIADAEHFSKLHDLIKDDEHIVQELNKTAANFTIFAPANIAFEKLEKRRHKPTKEAVKEALLYHSVAELYPAGRVLKSKTIQTLYHEKEIGTFQRLAVDIGLRGLTLNYVARVVYPDVFTSNGIIHAVDSVIFPPLPIYETAEILPSFFSTFVNAAWKTGLVGDLNETTKSTIFAPSNVGFAKLGPRINAYLFSERGTPALRKLLKYHVVPDVLFYSDNVTELSHRPSKTGLATHYEFETLLGEDKKINVDVKEFFRFKSIVFNGRTIGVSDIPARNGVLSKLDNVILPYKNDLEHGRDISELSLDEFDALLDVAEEQSLEDKLETFVASGAFKDAKEKVEDKAEDVMEWFKQLPEDVRDFL